MGHAEPEWSGATINFGTASPPIGWEAEPVDYNKIRG
jgi:hypothetical protein